MFTEGGTCNTEMEAFLFLLFFDKLVEHCYLNSREGLCATTYARATSKSPIPSWLGVSDARVGETVIKGLNYYLLFSGRHREEPRRCVFAAVKRESSALGPW